MPVSTPIMRACAIAFIMAVAADVHAQDMKPRDGLVCLIVNKNSGRCLSVAEKSVEQGARIVQSTVPKDAGPSERWTLLATGAAFRLKNEHSGLVLEIGGANPNRGVWAIQWQDAVNKPKQLWTFESVDDGFYLLHTGHSNQVLAVGQSALDEGARVIQWPLFPNLADQHWQLRSIDPDAAPADNNAPPPEQPEAQSSGRLLIFAAAGTLIVLLAAIMLTVIILLRCRAGAAQKSSSETDAAEASTPMTSTACPGCGRALKIKTTMIGRKVKCSKCNTVVLVPDAQRNGAIETAVKRSRE